MVLGVDRIGRMWEQSIKGIPITIDMLKVISSMRGFDAVILCMYDINNSRKEIEKTLCFHPANVLADIKDQRIKVFSKFDIPNAFDLPQGARVTMDDYEVKDGLVSFTTKVDVL